MNGLRAGPGFAPQRPPAKPPRCPSSSVLPRLSSVNELFTEVQHSSHACQLLSLNIPPGALISTLFTFGFYQCHLINVLLRNWMLFWFLLPRWFLRPLSLVFWRSHTDESPCGSIYSTCWVFMRSFRLEMHVLHFWEIISSIPIFFSVLFWNYY